MIYYGHCYYVPPVRLNFFDAKTWCNGYGATKMIVNDVAEYNLLVGFYQALGSSSANLWVYLNNKIIE